MLNLLLLALVFVPLERTFPRLPGQGTFRFGWATDGMHFAISHLAVQVLTFVSLLPGSWLVARLGDPFGPSIRSQPLALQILQWHHAVTPTDRNFAVHFPWLDRLFGTRYLPDGAWPDALGIRGNPVQEGYLRQLLHPFRRNSRS